MNANANVAAAAAARVEEEAKPDDYEDSVEQVPRNEAHSRCPQSPLRGGIFI